MCLSFCSRQTDKCPSPEINWLCRDVIFFSTFEFWLANQFYSSMNALLSAMIQYESNSDYIITNAFNLDISCFTFAHMHMHMINTDKANRLLYLWFLTWLQSSHAHAQAQRAADIFSGTEGFHDLVVCGFATPPLIAFRASVAWSKEPLISPFPMQYACLLLSLHCYLISNSNFFPISSFLLSVVNSSFVGDTFFIAIPTQGSNWNFRFLRSELNLSLSRCIFFANGMNGR